VPAVKYHHGVFGACSLGERGEAREDPGSRGSRIVQEGDLIGRVAAVLAALQDLGNRLRIGDRLRRVKLRGKPVAADSDQQGVAVLKRYETPPGWLCSEILWRERINILSPGL
jgi:hypothetical protein